MRLLNGLEFVIAFNEVFGVKDSRFKKKRKKECSSCETTLIMKFSVMVLVLLLILSIM